MSRYRRSGFSASAIWIPEWLRSTTVLLGLLLLAWLLRAPLARNWTALRARLPGLGAPLPLQADELPAETLEYGFPCPGLKLADSSPETLLKLNSMGEQLDFHSALGAEWSSRNMLRLSGPYGCRHYAVFLTRERWFHLYRLTLPCGHTLDVVPDLDSQQELADARPLVTYAEHYYCPKCGGRKAIDSRVSR